MTAGSATSFARAMRRFACVRVPLLSALLALLPAPVRADAPDLTTREMQAIRREFIEQTERQAQSRVQELTRLVQDNVDWANAQLEENTRSGNISGLAVARAAVRMFEACAEEMEAKGDFAIPDRVRRELTDRVRTLEQNKNNIEQKYSILLEPLRDRFFLRFSDLAQEQLGRFVPDDQLKVWFDQLVRTEVKPPPATPPETMPGEPPPPDAPPAPELPDVLASSGHADNWVTFGYWFARVHALELIRIPVLNVTEERKHTGKGEMSGADLETLYRPVRALQRSETMTFRIKSVKGRLGADVVEWPGPRNRWTLYLRVRPHGASPSLHAIELQVNADAVLTAAAPVSPIAGPDVGEPKPPPARPVKLSVRSVPPGAEIFVDGERQMVNNVPLRTPAEIVVPEGPREIRLTLFGFLDGVLRDFAAKPGAVAEWTFVKDRGMEKVTVRAFAQTGWRGTRIRVNKGDRLSIVVVGQWSCGEGRENTDALGYPQARFPQYYRAPHGDRRLLRTANYGALLMRIGDKGRVGAVGRSLRFVAPESGELYFGINEQPRFLRDNSGSLNIQIEKSSGGQ